MTHKIRPGRSHEIPAKLVMFQSTEEYQNFLLKILPMSLNLAHKKKQPNNEDTLCVDKLHGINRISDEQT